MPSPHHDAHRADPGRPHPKRVRAARDLRRPCGLATTGPSRRRCSPFVDLNAAGVSQSTWLPLCWLEEGSPVPRLEHHIWVLEGVLEVTIGDQTQQTRARDCLRFRLSRSGDGCPASPIWTAWLMTSSSWDDRWAITRIVGHQLAGRHANRCSSTARTSKARRRDPVVYGSPRAVSGPSDVRQRREPARTNASRRHRSATASALDDVDGQAAPSGLLVLVLQIYKPLTSSYVAFRPPRPCPGRLKREPPARCAGPCPRPAGCAPCWTALGACRRAW